MFLLDASTIDERPPLRSRDVQLSPLTRDALGTYIFDMGHLGMLPVYPFVTSAQVCVPNPWDTSLWKVAQHNICLCVPSFCFFLTVDSLLALLEKCLSFLL
jgi:hypothetical protein